MSNGEKKTKKDLHREAYGAAMSRLRKAYPDEFNVLRMEEAKKRGLEWKPKPSEKEKARQQLALLLRDYPELVSEFGQPSADVPSTGGVA